VAIRVYGDPAPRLAVEGQAQVTHVFRETGRGAIPEGGVDVSRPQIGGFDDVDVAVEDLEDAMRHVPPP